MAMASSASSASSSSLSSSTSSLSDLVPSGVVTGDDLFTLLEHARTHAYAIPAVNCTSASAANAAMEAGRKAGSPVMIQLSYGGGEFVVGEGVARDEARHQHPPTQGAALAGTISLALHVRSVADHYGIPVVLHSDHCAKDLLPWFDDMLKIDEQYYEKNGEALFSSHMLDLSEEPDEDNIAICVQYFKRMVSMKLWLEMEIGITGGIEDAVDNSQVEPEQLYTTPQQVWNVYQELSKISPMFSIAAAFGNVHGVYNPGNVILSPERLGHHQEYTTHMLHKTTPTPNDSRPHKKNNNPIFLVMHGGSGATEQEFATAIRNGVVKVNFNTELQWAYWDGVRQYEAKYREYLQGQLGNPEGSELPNKKFYDGRTWIRRAEISMCKQVMVSMDQLGSAKRYKNNSNISMAIAHRLQKRNHYHNGGPFQRILARLQKTNNKKNTFTNTGVLVSVGFILGCVSTLFVQSVMQQTVQFSRQQEGQ